MKNLYIIVLSILITYCVYGDQENNATLLRRGERLPSPDKIYSCISAKPLDSEDGATLIVYVSNEKKPPGAWVLLEGNRSVSVCWSSDSKWLVVFDHFGASENRCFIYKMGKDGPILIYKTIEHADKQLSWDIDSWDLANGRIKLNSIDASTGAKQTSSIQLDSKRGGDANSDTNRSQ